MPNIPAIVTPPIGLDPGLTRMLMDIKTVLENINAQVITDPALTAEISQVVAASQAVLLTSINQVPSVSVTPGTVSGLSSIASRYFTLLSWDSVPPAYDLDTFIIYRSLIDNKDNATEIGTSRTLVYADYTQSDDTYYYWVAVRSRGSTATPAGIIGQLNTDSPTISVSIDSRINSGNVTDYFDGKALGVDQFAVVNLAAISATLGDITAGTLKNSTGTFEIDLINEFIRIAGPFGFAADDYIIIQNGLLQQFTWNGSTHIPSASLTTIETDTASNGATVTLGKSYATQPEVIVTAYDTPIYKAANTAQDQTIQIRSENLRETSPGSGTWEFEAISRLVIAAGTSSVVINDTEGPLSGNVTIPTSSTDYTTPANCEDITISLDLTSVRGTGTAPDYNNRTVTWTVYYRVSGSSDSYTSVSAGAKAIGNTLGAVNDTHMVTFSSTGTWDFHIIGVFNDTGGTFSDGASGFIEGPGGTRTAADAYVLLEDNYSAGNKVGSDTAFLDPVLGSFTATSGYTIYQVNYTWKLGYYTYTLDSGSSLGTSCNASTTNITSEVNHSSNAGGGFDGPNSTGLSGANQAISKSAQTGSYNTTYISGDLAVDWDGDGGIFNDSIPDCRAELRFTNMQAIIRERKPITNSTTAANTIKVNDFIYTLAAGQELSTGTLRYQAIL